MTEPLSTFAMFHVGDVLKVLRTLPDESVDFVLSSPPFLNLRAYLPDDHPNKADEIGSEDTPGAFIDRLLDVTEACRRVLAPHGSLAFELGDTYAGSGGAGGDYSGSKRGEGGSRAGQPKFAGSASKAREASRYDGRYNRPDGHERTGDRYRGEKDGWPVDKSLCLVPESYRWSLVYGRNPFTGRETPRWRARNVVRWWRPNPPVGQLSDKFRPATSDMVIVCKDDRAGAQRYFDLDAVREAPKNGREPGEPITNSTAFSGHPNAKDGMTRPDRVSNPGGAPPQDTWEVATEAYKGSHYATWPRRLLRRPILAMTPIRVCTTCGEPSRRLTVPSDRYAEYLGDGKGFYGADGEAGRDRQGTHGYDHEQVNRMINEEGLRHAERITVGWTDCRHGTWRPGVVLDPFAGSGTTLLVAMDLGRASIGIDLDERNADLARDRVGMFLEVVERVG